MCSISLIVKSTTDSAAGQLDRAEGIGIGDVGDLRHHRHEAAAVDRLAARERHGPEGPPVKRAPEGDDVLPAGLVPGELEGGLDGLGPGVGEEHPVAARHRRQLGQPLGQHDLLVVVEIGARHVQEPGGLLLNRPDHVRMRVAGGRDGNAGRQVEEPVAVRVDHHRADGPVDHQRIVAGIGGTHHPLVAGHHLPRLGAGNLAHQCRGGGLLRNQQRTSHVPQDFS